MKRSKINSKPKSLPKRGRGRPEKPIDWDKLQYLAECQCTATEVAGYFGIDTDTLARRMQKQFGVNYTVYAAKYWEKGKASLRVRQFEAAMDKDNPNNTMLVFLGKNYLGQSDRQTNETTIKQDNQAAPVIQLNVQLPKSLADDNAQP